jgi:hypothetical protein
LPVSMWNILCPLHQNPFLDLILFQFQASPTLKPIPMMSSHVEMAIFKEFPPNKILCVFLISLIPL